MGWNPLVSIIIPLYNGANYVEEAILCALNQTYKNIEIIVVNDGSIDDGAGKIVCQKYQDKIVYVEKENGGCSSALNYGVKIAKGEYVSWLSHDDLYDCDKIERQIYQITKRNLDTKNTIISNPARLVTGSCRKIFHPTKKTGGFFSSKKAFRYMLRKKTLNGCGLLIPKELFERVGCFDESMRYVLDWDLWLKFAIAGVDFYLDKKITVSIRCHNAQVTVRQKQLYQTETDVMAKSLFAILKEKDEPLYIKELFYFSYSTDKEVWKDIKSFCVGKIKLSMMKAKCLRFKRNLVNILKKLYHKLRKG